MLVALPDVLEKLSQLLLKLGQPLLLLRRVDRADEVAELAAAKAQLELGEMDVDQHLPAHFELLGASCQLALLHQEGAEGVDVPFYQHRRLGDGQLQQLAVQAALLRERLDQILYGHSSHPFSVD